MIDVIGGRICIRAIALAAVVCGLAVGGCGSDDDADGSGDERSGQEAGFSKSSDFVATGDDKQQIRQVLEAIQKDFGNVDGAAYCDKLIPSEQREIAAYGRNFGTGTTCVGTMNNVARKTKKTGIKQLRNPITLNC